MSLLSRHARWPLKAVVVCAWLSCGFAACGQEDDEDFPQYRPGLVAEYQNPGGPACVRCDNSVNFVWRGASPDPRLGAGPFTANWRGRLFSIVPGSYTLHVYSAGKVTLRLKDQLLLEVDSKQPGWHAATPIDLTYGYHPLEIDFEKLGDQARLSLYWQGPRFQLEPVPERHLFHDPANSPNEQFAVGRRLTRTLRCQACHEIGGQREYVPAPALTQLPGNLSRPWLVNWLASDPTGEEASTAQSDTDEKTILRRMPHLAIDRPQAEAIADYLWSTSAETPTKQTSPKASGNAAAGAKLFRTTGCLACHQAGGLGQATLFGGGDLSAIAQKRPADFFARWLTDPSKINAAHRMPVFKLTARETADLSAYLTTLDGIDQKEPTTADASVSANVSVNLGRQLIAEHRCGACHALPENPRAKLAKPAPAKSLSATSDWSRGCLGEPVTSDHRPGYRLGDAQSAAVREYVTSLPTESADSLVHDGQFVLEERNCVGCHMRGNEQGIAAQLAAMVAADPELAPELPTFAPPALLGVGDKLHEKALIAAIKTQHEPRRPWLAVRMPRFDLSEAELEALVKHFVDSDRIPDLPSPKPATKAPPKKEFAAAGGRLVTSDGFGCTSCHKIGNSIPQKVALNARGTDLSDLGSRIRRPWYDRWVRNPARIVPRMEMPSIVAPVRNVLNEDLHQQLAAVWHVLDLPDFDPPPPSAIRVVRSSNLPGHDEPAAVLTDVLEVGKQVLIRPLVLGLPNRHNVLFDLESNSLAGWWLGDTAVERTRGKSWYWEPHGSHVFEVQTGESDLKLHRGGVLHQPVLRGQFPTEFDWVEHVPYGVSFGQRLRFEPQESDAVELSITQTLTAIRPAEIKESPAASGFRRRLSIVGLPEGAELVLTSLPGAALSTSSDGRVLSRTDVGGNCRIRLLSPGDARFGRQAEPAALVLRGGKSDKPLVCELEYLCDLPVDQGVAAAPPRPALPAAQLNVVPGYTATRLPLSDEEMPIGLAWREDGVMIVCSLKGRVCLASDSDGDGLEDLLQPFSDELAAPYGAVARDGAIDVITKYALLRLHDRDANGHAERTEVLASGWGYTPDYHDWAVGLESDEAGNYYIALPCQQDNRSLAAAHLRGQGLKLSPKCPTKTDPHRYAIEPFCGGLRFPMGLARSRHGELFATDNQGNYNPFNELNHLWPGKRYGFINKLEQKPGFDPPLTPPAINIPHPWTRSVNGIAFLDTPPALRARLGRDAFGPFEGHLIGCEYDSRQLVRMSLEQVDGVYQGAIYPFTAPLAEGQEPLQGPISCAVSPAGELYVGNIRDSGWGGGTNVGSIVRLKPQGELPPGIAEVRATPNGFRIRFTAPVDASLAARPESYAISLYRRISTPAYGGPDVDRQAASVKHVDLSADNREVKLELDKLPAGFVYELRLVNLAPGGGVFHPDEAHYTLQRVLSKAGR